MTHPDILKMERDGFLGEPQPVIAECEFCDKEIYDGDEYYDVHGAVLCGNYECVFKLIKMFRRDE